MQATGQRMPGLKKACYPVRFVAFQTQLTCCSYVVQALVILKTVNGE